VQKEHEIEVTPDYILIKRTDNAASISQFEERLLEIADRLADARSPFDGEQADGETVYFSINSNLAEIIRSVVLLAARQRSEGQSHSGDKTL
jgi:hypothetical protein